MPKVSILIPVFNRKDFITECIQSALNQSFDDFEVIVMDNASSDGTWEQIQRIAAQDSRVRAFRNETNIGPVRNWIECARQARGKFSKILWSDDLLDAAFLSRTIPLLEDPLVGFVYTSVRIFKNSLEATLGAVHYSDLATGLHDTRMYIEESLLGIKLPVSPGCFILRTDDLRKNLQADIPNSVGSDFKNHAIGNDLLLLLLTAKGYEKFGVVNEPLSMFRDHAGSISVSSGLNRLVIHYDMTRAYFVQRCGVDPSLLHRFNTLLWWHRHQFDGNAYGIRRIRDFYPASADTRISISFLLTRALSRVFRFN